MMYEGELVLTALLNTLEKSGTVNNLPSLLTVINGKPQKTPLAPSVTNSFTPDFDGFSLDKYFMPELILPIYSSRQCFSNCAFCTIPGATNGRYRTVDIARVVDIMDELSVKYNTCVFSFVDETLEASRLDALSKELLSRGRHYFWHGETRFSPRLTKDVFKRLFSAGCRQLQLGLESYNQRVLNLMKKNTKVEWIDQNINDALESGIPVHLFFMTGFPTETREEALNTISYTEQVLNSSRSRYNNPYSTRGFDAFGLDIGSDVWNHPDSYGVTPIPNDEQYNIRLNVRYESRYGMSMDEVKDVIISHRLDHLKTMLDETVFEYEVPDRIHISEAIWVLDASHGITPTPNTLHVARCPSYFRSPIQFRNDCNFIILSGNCYIYSLSTHAICKVKSNRIKCIKGVYYYVSQNDQFDQSTIPALSFYNMLVDDQPVFTNYSDTTDYLLMANPFISVTTVASDTFLIVTPTQKISRAGTGFTEVIDNLHRPKSVNYLNSILNQKYSITTESIRNLISIAAHGELIIPLLP